MHTRACHAASQTCNQSYVEGSAKPERWAGIPEVQSDGLNDQERSWECNASHWQGPWDHQLQADLYVTSRTQRTMRITRPATACFKLFTAGWRGFFIQ
jgi:hypothetical protein